MKTLIQSFLYTVAFFLASAWLLTVLAHAAQPSPIRVGVIDTGLDLSDPRFAPHLCSSGHGDFSGTGLTDTEGHGTHVAGTIMQYSRGSNYCLIIVKFYNKREDDIINAHHIYKALQYILTLHLDVLNLSLSGPNFDSHERDLLSAHPEVIVIGAAGNDHSKRVHYPCGYILSNLTCVGAIDATGNVASYSNYGNWIQVWELGDIDSTLPKGKHGVYSGTSMACAIHTGKTIYSIDSRRK